MTPQEIIDNNILLAEFLGWKTDSVEMVVPEQLREAIQFDHNKEYFTTTIFKHKDAKFRNDWNWLNILINKIGDKTGYELVSGYSYAYWNNMGDNPIGDFGGYSDIRNIYEACVAFVKWYNQNKGGK